MRAEIWRLLLDLDALFGDCEIGTSPQRLYEGCNLGGVITGYALIMLRVVIFMLAKKVKHHA